MIASRDTGEAIAEGHAGDETFRGVRKIGNGKVYLSLAHQCFEVLGIGWAEHNLRAWGLNGEISHHGRQQESFDEIRSDEGKSAPTRVGNKLRRKRDHLLNHGDELIQLIHELLSPHRRRQAFGAAHKQLIVKQSSKACQRRAHGRLCDAKFFRCARDMTLGKQHAQRDKEIEIEAAHIHRVYDSHIRDSMAEKRPPTSYSDRAEIWRLPTETD